MEGGGFNLCLVILNEKEWCEMEKEPPLHDLGDQKGKLLQDRNQRKKREENERGKKGWVYL